MFPKESEFRKNYEKNRIDITNLSYDECILEFIPISDSKFYIFDRINETFEGTIILEDIVAEVEEENDILYTDIWDIRTMNSDWVKNKRNHRYVLLNEMESKFVSFLKLPKFTELYLKNLICFPNETAMYQFFITNKNCKVPKKIITENGKKYEKIIKDICQKREMKEKWLQFGQWIERVGTNKLKVNILDKLFNGENDHDLENKIKKYEEECLEDLDLYVIKSWWQYRYGDLNKAYAIIRDGLQKNPFNFTLNQAAYTICINRNQLIEALRYIIILTTLQDSFSEFPRIEYNKQELLEKIVEQHKEFLIQGDKVHAEQCFEGIKNAKKLWEVAAGFHDHKYFWRISYPVSKTVGIIYEDAFGNKKYNALYEENYVKKVLPYLNCSFDNWVLVKLDCREVSNTNELLLGDDGEYLLPVLQEENNFTFKFILSDNKEIICLNKVALKFEYYRLPPATRLVSEKNLYVGNPIVLKQNPKNKKLVLNIFVDGISQKVIEEENFAELMPHTNAFFSKGIRCNQAYSAAEWTLPSLASYTSGITPARHMMIHNNITKQFPEDITILAEYFKEQGYQTAKIDGDWRSTQSYGYGRGMDRIIYQHQNVGMKVEQVIEDTLDHIKLMQETNQFVWMCIGDLPVSYTHLTLPTNCT